MKLDSQKIIDKGNSISYSKLKQYKQCQASWAISNFGILTDQTRDETKAITGIIIQKIFELIYNEKLFKKYKWDDFQTWVHEYISAFLDINLFKVHEQLLPEHKENSRTPHNIKIAATRKRKALATYTLLQDIEIAPKYVDFEKLYSTKDFSNKEELIQYLYDIVIKNMTHLQKTLKFDKENIKSEIKIRVQMDGYELVGIVDFIEGDYTKTDYRIFDGKIKDNSFVDLQQIVFYAYLIHKAYNTNAKDKAGYIIWDKAKFKEAPITPEGFKQVETDVNTYLQTIKQIQTQVKDTTEYDLDDIDLKYTGSFTNCMFCINKAKCLYSV